MDAVSEDNSITELEAALAPFLNKTPKDIDAEYEPVQRAQIYNALASATATLFSHYLKIRGVNPAEESAFQKEQDRLRQFDKKVRKIAAEDELSKAKRPTLELDVAAMTRFIAAAVPHWSAEQKQALKKAGSKPKEERKKKREDDGNGNAKRKKKSSAAASSKDAALEFLHETLAVVKPPPPGGSD